MTPKQWNFFARFTQYRKKYISTLKQPNGLPCIEEQEEAKVIEQYMTRTLKCSTLSHATPIPHIESCPPTAHGG